MEVREKLKKQLKDILIIILTLKFRLFKKNFLKYRKKIKVIIHCAAQPSHDWAKDKAFIDFDINAKGTLNLLELTKKFTPEIPFIFMSTNKVYGDNPNKLPLIEKKTRWEIKLIIISKTVSMRECPLIITPSFFGASKAYADLIVQEYGKNIGLKTACFRAGCITGQTILVQITWFPFLSSKNFT